MNRFAPSLRLVAAASALAAACSGAPSRDTSSLPPMPAGPTERVVTATHPTLPHCHPDEAPEVDAMRFHPSPGGVPEVSTRWVAEHGCHVHLVDVREPDELEEAGHVPGAEHVPLGRLPEVAMSWNPRDPVVFVCRSGRRSARAVHTVEAMGFDRAASMTGGMLAWGLSRYPVGHDAELHGREVGVARAAEADYEGPPTSESLKRYLEAAPIQNVRVAALLLQGTEACVDGREEHAVLGTPGGDAGELLLALSTIEAMTGRELAEDDIMGLFDAYVEGFGRFYVHTDDHALEHLLESLEADPIFRELLAEAEGPEAKLEAVERLIRRPPTDVREALLGHLLTPANIGCGHLKLVASHPDEYAVREGLTQSFLRVVYRMLWAHAEMLDFVVLHGEHEEEAVINVHFPREVHAFSNVPAVPPRIGHHSVFVNHPEVAAFLRGQHARFLLQEAPELAEGLTPERFEAELNARAARQLGATVRHLAAELPVFDVRFVDGRVDVEQVR